MSFFNNIPLPALICWVILLGSVLITFIAKIIGKNKYRNQEMHIDTNWYETSQNHYANRQDSCLYYFHPDKNFFHSGHLMENKSHTIVYEAKFLYNNLIGNDEVDFINHIIGYTHHHKVGHTLTRSIEHKNLATNLSSSFDFDGVDIWDYLSNLGYSYHFNIKGFAYTIDILKSNSKIGTIYSSNNGKNFFNNDVIEAKMGGKGYCIVECNIKDIDVLFLYAMAFARTDLNIKNL